MLQAHKHSDHLTSLCKNRMLTHLLRHFLPVQTPKYLQICFCLPLIENGCEIPFMKSINRDKSPNVVHHFDGERQEDRISI